MPKVRSATLGTCHACKAPLSDIRDWITGEFGVSCSFEDCHHFGRAIPGRESNYEGDPQALDLCRGRLETAVRRGMPVDEVHAYRAKLTARAAAEPPPLPDTLEGK